MSIFFSSKKSLIHPQINWGSVWQTPQARTFTKTSPFFGLGFWIRSTCAPGNELRTSQKELAGVNTRQNPLSCFSPAIPNNQFKMDEDGETTISH